MNNQEFCNFYQQVKDPHWPECHTLQDFYHLPQKIKNECVNIHGMGKEVVKNLEHAADLELDVNFCFDRMLPCQQPWPNLVQYSGSITLDRNLGHDWTTTSPYAGYPRLLDYLTQNKIAFSMHDINAAPVHSLYLVDIWLWDHAVDYIGSISIAALDRLRKREIKLIFFYCEADSAAILQDTIYQQCDQHGVNPVDVMVIMGNTVTWQTPSNFLYFDDDCRVLRNYHQQDSILPWLPWHNRPRSKKMTFLNRVHKSWRCYFAAWYWHQQYHQDSYFSYRMVDHGEHMAPAKNPLAAEIKFNDEFESQVQAFLSQEPFSADDFVDSDHNDYGHRADCHYDDSYWHLVCETHLDMEHSQLGAFITEKTWKVIARAQPFVILGTAGSLAHLKSLGYKTFSEAGIDESYDTVQDPTRRFNAVKKLVSHIHSLDHDQLAELNQRCQSIVEYNQNKFFHDDGSHAIWQLLKQIYKKTSPRP